MAKKNDDIGMYDLAPDSEAASKDQPKRPAAKRPTPRERAAANAAAGKVPPRAGAKPPVNAGKGPPSAAAAASMAGRRPGPARRDDVHQQHAKKQLITLAAVAGGLAVLVVAAIVLFNVLGDSGPAAPALADDAAAKDVMAESSFEEAREWIKQGNNRSLVGHTTSQSENRIEAIYDLGAKQVLAGGGRMSMNLVIEMPPEDKETRQKLIDYANRWYERYELGKTPQTDVGQTYLLLHMPLAL